MRAISPLRAIEEARAARDLDAFRTMLGDREEFPDCRLDFDSLRGVHSDPLVEPEWPHLCGTRGAEPGLRLFSHEGGASKVLGVLQSLGAGDGNPEAVSHR